MRVACQAMPPTIASINHQGAQESQMMVPIMDRKAPNDVAKQWLKDHPEDTKRWLEGVTTFDGKDAAQAVQVAISK